MGEEHVDYMIMAGQLRSFNINTTPLMIASEVSVYCKPFRIFVSRAHLFTRAIDR